MKDTDELPIWKGKPRLPNELRRIREYNIYCSKQFEESGLTHISSETFDAGWEAKGITDRQVIKDELTSIETLIAFRKSIEEDNSNEDALRDALSNLRKRLKTR